VAVLAVEEVLQGEERECGTGVAGVEGGRVVIVVIVRVEVGVVALGEVPPDSHAGGGGGEGGLVATGAGDVDAGVDGGHGDGLSKRVRGGRELMCWQL